MWPDQQCVCCTGTCSRSCSGLFELGFTRREWSNNHHDFRYHYYSGTFLSRFILWLPKLMVLQTGPANTASVDPTVLATSNGRGGGLWSYMGSTSFGSSNAATGSNALLASAMFTSIASIVGVLLVIARPWLLWGPLKYDSETCLEEHPYHVWITAPSLIAASCSSRSSSTVMHIRDSTL